MRGVIVQELVSADGFVAGPSGELDFFEAVPDQDYHEADRDNLQLLGAVDTIALGRTTYEMFAQFWPTAEGEEMAEMVNSTPKLVFSSTLEAAPWGDLRPATVLSGDAATHLDRLRREPGGDIVVWGSISLARSLIGAGLVSELQLRVVPVLIGEGLSLLSPDVGRRDLTLLEAKPYASGIVSLRYALPRG